MTTENNYDDLHAQLQQELQSAEEGNQQPVSRYSRALAITGRYLKLLRQRVELNGFTSVQEEIDFFKRQKPRFYRWLIYYQECFVIEGQLPADTRPVLLDYYRQQFSFIHQFFRRHEFLFQYYRLGATELDQLYFVRGVRQEPMLTAVLPEADPVFATAQDYLFAKFMAYEQLREYLLKKLEALEPSEAAAGHGIKAVTQLRWTGDKVNLVEVIYALYFTGQLNDGNADLALIIQFMEQHLKIDLSRAYRDFIDIRNRKVSSPTRFIDQMRDSIHKRIDDDLAFKPVKKIFRGES